MTTLRSSSPLGGYSTVVKSPALEAEDDEVPCYYGKRHSISGITGTHVECSAGAHGRWSRHGDTRVRRCLVYGGCTLSVEDVRDPRVFIGSLSVEGVGGFHFFIGCGALCFALLLSRVTQRPALWFRDGRGVLLHILHER